MGNKNLTERIEALKAESVGGATLCTRAALECLLLFEGSQEELATLCQQLREAKPEMASIVSATVKCEEAGPAHLKETAQRLIRQIENAGEAIAFKLLKTLNPGDKIKTLSASGTVLQCLLAAHREKGIEVCLSESRPLLEGEQLARQLAAAKVPTTLVVDAALLTLLPHCQAVWVGADTLTLDFFVNKIGTLALALAANRMGVPFYVLCDSLKQLPSGFEHKREADHPITEVLNSPPEGLAVQNPYFERVPLDLVTAIVTEI